MGGCRRSVALSERRLPKKLLLHLEQLVEHVVGDGAIRATERVELGVVLEEGLHELAPGEPGVRARRVGLLGSSREAAMGS